MPQALYRQYRPKDFDSVVGQEHITRTLKNEIAAGRPAHAYLFTGPRGTGKTSCSKILAKAVNCPNEKDGNPCGVCDFCRGVDEGSVMDVVEIDAASNNGVDNVRQLREEAQFTPSVGKYRVYIIDEVHMLSAGAFNALLKIMEEPPAHVIFILATTEAHKLPSTIVSRCQRFDFKRIETKDVAARLLNVAGQEGIQLEPAAAFLIGKLAEGGMRDALSLLDVCRSYSGRVDEAVVRQAAGLVLEDSLFALADCVRSRDFPRILLLLDEARENGVDYERLAGQLLNHYRSLMLLKASASPEVLDLLPEQRERYVFQAKEESLGAILAAMSRLQQALANMARSPHPRVELEMAFLRMTNPALDTSGAAILARLERLEEQLRSGVPAAEAARSAPRTQEAPGQAPAPPAQPAGPAAPKQEKAPAPLEKPQAPLEEVRPFPEWPQVMGKLQRKNKALFGALADSRAYLSGNLVLIQCDNDFFLNLLRNGDAARQSLHEAILEVTGKKHRLGPYKKEKYRVAEEADPLNELIAKAEESDTPLTLR